MTHDGENERERERESGSEEKEDKHLVTPKRAKGGEGKPVLR